MNALSTTVVVDGPSWEGAELGMYCFEVFVNGVRGQLHIQEELALDFRGAGTLSAATCLDILRLHRVELAEALARKLKGGGDTESGHYLLAWQDLIPGCLASRLAHFPTTRAPGKHSRSQDRA
jgi:hypothetical protein